MHVVFDDVTYKKQEFDFGDEQHFEAGTSINSFLAELEDFILTSEFGVDEANIIDDPGGLIAELCERHGVRVL